MARSRTITPVEVQNYLTGVDYPVNKDELIQSARDQDAPDEVLEILNQIPDREYQKPTDVTREIGFLE